MNVEHVLTSCPFCGCGCNFYLQVIDNKLTGTIPCRTDEISKGQLCIKGRNAHVFVESKDRLTTPLIKQDGKFKEISWQEALTIIGKELTKIKQSSAPDSIGFVSSAKCTNEENFVMMKFVRAVIGTNNIDHCARL